MSQSNPVQLNIVISTNNAGTITTSTVTVPLSPGLQAIDSGAIAGQGVASGQTGFSSVAQALANIFRQGFFVVAGTAYPVGAIQSISWS